MDKIEKEFIICSAVHFKDGKKHQHQPINIKEGFVVTGRRHHNCYATLSAIGESIGIEESLRKLMTRTDRDGQGFITSQDRYVDRKEGFIIAKEANQLLMPNLHDNSGKVENELASEDIFGVSHRDYFYDRD